jgi:hypothetical protein
MRAIKKTLQMLSLVGAVVLSNAAVAQSATDNEILLEQVGNTLDLTILQQGYGNKISGDSTQSSDMVITGANLTIDLDQVGNSNNFYGAMTSDNSTMDWLFTGSTNVWDILMGDLGSTDSADILVDITGDGNTMDFDIGSVTSAERVDFDLTLLGDSNVFNVDIEVDDSTWNFDITGDNNDFLTSQTDGAYQYMKVIYDGSGGDIDLIQSSGTCPTGTTSCYGHIDLDIDSENATISITQSD